MAGSDLAAIGTVGVAFLPRSGLWERHSCRDRDKNVPPTASRD